MPGVTPNDFPDPKLPIPPIVPPSDSTPKPTPTPPGVCLYIPLGSFPTRGSDSDSDTVSTTTVAMPWRTQNVSPLGNLPPAAWCKCGNSASDFVTLPLSTGTAPCGYPSAAIPTVNVVQVTPTQTLFPPATKDIVRPTPAINPVNNQNEDLKNFPDSLQTDTETAQCINEGQAPKVSVSEMAAAIDTYCNDNMERLMGLGGFTHVASSYTPSGLGFQTAFTPLLMLIT